MAKCYSGEMLFGKLLHGEMLLRRVVIWRNVIWQNVIWRDVTEPAADICLAAQRHTPPRLRLNK